jgi:MoaA/NifB/PqqE/SkfB family radical SAM enzyme
MRTLLDKLKAIGVSEVLFTGGGEPLLNQQTPEAMHYASLVLGMKVGLYTNGALVTEKKAREIMMAKPAYARVSSNAGSREVYLRHHCPLNAEVDFFERNQRAVEFLAVAKRDLGVKSILGVSYWVDPENAADVVDGASVIAELASRYPGMINYMRFTPSVNYYGAQQHPKDVFDAALADLERVGIPLLQSAGVEATVYRHRFSGIHEPRTYAQCLAHGWYGGVGPRGILYLCCERLFDPKFAFGSLLDEPFEKLWNGDRRRQVLEFASQAVRGETECPCPVVCKPNEHNKVFNRIEELRAEGKIEVVRTWLDQIHKIIAASLSQEQGRLFGFSASPNYNH